MAREKASMDYTDTVGTLFSPSSLFFTDTKALLLEQLQP
jgi:hypothetical protein